MDLKRALQKVAIHNKNGKGLLQNNQRRTAQHTTLVAIHNKNGKGLLQTFQVSSTADMYSRNPQ